MTKARWTVPESWAWAAVADLGKVTGGGTPSAGEPTNFADVGIPWITPADLTGYKEPYIARGRRDLSDKGYASCGATLMAPGTVLFSSRAPVGYCVIAANEISTNQGFKSVVLADSVLPEYLRHYLLASKDYAESLASGTTFLELSGARFADLAVPVPPHSEQRRIVAGIDAVTARTARARADLGRIPDLAASYKQAVLSQLFSADSLGARTVRFFDVLDIKGGSQPPKSTFEAAPGPGLVRLLQIRDFASDAKAVYIRDEPRWPKCQPDDIMVGRYGASVGKVLSGKGGAYNVALVKVLFDRTTIDRDFLFLWLQSATFQRALGAVSRSAQDGFNKGDLEDIPFPLVSIEHQQREASRAFKALTEIDRLTAEAAAARRLLDRLDQAVLAKAFRGELVSQDPADEPASVLLARVRAERAAAPRPKRGRRAGA